MHPGHCDPQQHAEKGGGVGAVAERQSRQERHYVVRPLGGANQCKDWKMA